MASEPHKNPRQLCSAESGSRPRQLATPWWADGLPKHANDPTLSIYTQGVCNWNNWNERTNLASYFAGPLSRLCQIARDSPDQAGLAWRTSRGCAPAPTTAVRCCATWWLCSPAVATASATWPASAASRQVGQETAAAPWVRGSGGAPSGASAMRAPRAARRPYAAPTSLARPAVPADTLWGAETRFRRLEAAQTAGDGRDAEPACHHPDLERLCRLRRRGGLAVDRFRAKQCRARWR
jgi:hypothetical protein